MEVGGLWHLSYLCRAFLPGAVWTLPTGSVEVFRGDVVPRTAPPISYGNSRYHA